jgi:hypothetical protein
METLQRTANRGSISTGYDIDNSLKLEADNGEVLTQTIGAGSRTTATYSFWFKRTELGADMQLAGISPIASETTRFIITSNDVLDVESGVAGDNNSLVTNRVFRDTSAWYHFVVAIDTTQSTEANRVKVYVNGVQETSFSASEYPAQNTDLTIGVDGYTWSWGAYTSTQIKSSGYLAEAYYIDAQQLDPTSFGEFDEDSGIWKPIAYTGSFGSNGHYLDFSDASDLGNNSSGVGDDFTLNNITSADQATDTPTNNFCTFNPLMTQNNPPTISEGAMKSTGGGGTWNQTWGNMGVKNGKWYYEFKVTNTSSTGYFGASTAPAEGSDTTAASLMYNTSFMVGSSASIDYYYWQNGSQVSDESTGWGTISTNDIIGIALDLDAATKTFTVYKNGTALSGTLSQPVDLPTNMQDEFIFPLYVQYENAADEANFGGYTVMSISSAATDANGYGTFEYAPPTGYYALCTKNLAEFG